MDARENAPLVVSDTELDSTGESWPKGRTPDGGVNFGYSDSKVWIVETAAQSCP